MQINFDEHVKKISRINTVAYTLHTFEFFKVFELASADLISH